jgi:hypothetical protein
MGMRKNVSQTTPAKRRQQREARSAEQRARALALRQSGLTFAAIGGALGVSVERARQIVLRAERLANHPHWSDKLPVRAANFLRWQGLAELPEIEAAQAVAKLSRLELLIHPNFGRGACDALQAWARRALRQRSKNETGTPTRERPSDSDSSNNSPRQTGCNSNSERDYDYSAP